jgi:hypothetical protein
VSYWTKIAGHPLHVNCREPMTDEERDALEGYLAELVEAAVRMRGKPLDLAQLTHPQCIRGGAALCATT